VIQSTTSLIMTQERVDTKVTNQKFPPLPLIYHLVTSMLDQNSLSQILSGAQYARHSEDFICKN